MTATRRTTRTCGSARRPRRAGETPEQAAERELWEETGLRADGPLRPIAVQSLPRWPG
ncbi:NUDIX domain-containing protein [Micromonospora sp. M12]